MTGANRERIESSIAEWMREGLLWDLVEYETMERAIKGASWYVFLLSLRLTIERLWQWSCNILKGSTNSNWTWLTHPL
jgi:hypothetical protein